MASSIKGRILLVDDELHVRKLLSHELRKNRFEVETASNWSEAHEKLLSSCFDILLIDLHLPGIDGDRFVRILRQTKIGYNIKMVLFSQEEEEILAERAALAAADGYIPKYDYGQQFIQKLETYLSEPF